VGKNRYENNKKKLVLNIAYGLPTVSFFLFCWKNTDIHFVVGLQQKSVVNISAYRKLSF
jgi:hypothetical protein